MPAPRESCAVTCSRSARWGDLRKVSSPNEEAAEAELAKLRDLVPLMVKHWAMRHELTVNPAAPIAVKALIAKAAREMAEQAAATDQREP